MLGFGDKQGHTVDPTTLPVFVHAIQSTDAFQQAQKVWENNIRYVIEDPTNHKELMRFVFSQPSCVVWLERDEGRTDIFELILMWDVADAGKEDVTEVYVISTARGTPVGDDSRAKGLLGAILASPAIVPVNGGVNRPKRK
jgi:hypothetical protein